MSDVDRGEGAAAVGGRGVLLLVLAVGLGVLVLQAFDSGSVPFAQVPPDTSPTLVDTTVGGVPATTTSTQPPRPPAEVPILAANGTSTAGLAGRTAEFLKGSGFTNILTPVDATRLLESSAVEFAPGFEREARQVAQLLGLPATAVRAMSATPPVPDASGARVIVLIAPDLDRPLAGATTTTTR